MTNDEKRKLEMERGAQVLAQRFIAREFDPDYEPQSKDDEGPNSHISAAERARRDEYRKNLGWWKRTYEPDKE